MTPEQEAALLSGVHSIEKKVSIIETVCTGCQETLSAHELMLHGRAGNSQNPGLSTRTSLLEQRAEATEEAQEKSVKWLRAQLGAFIAAAIAVFSKWFVKG